MQMKKNQNKIIVIGAGGHSKSCIDVITSIKKFNIIGIIDNHSNQGSVLNIKIIGNDKDIPSFKKKTNYAFIGVGQIKEWKTRYNIFYLLKKHGFKLPTIISPLAYVSKFAEIEEGTIIMHHCLINAGAKIGKNSIINTGAIIEHDTIIGHHNHISTGVVVNGNVKIGDKNFIGSNSVINNNIIIGNEKIIPSSSRVSKNLDKKK